MEVFILHKFSLPLLKGVGNFPSKTAYLGVHSMSHCPHSSWWSPPTSAPTTPPRSGEPPRPGAAQVAALLLCTGSPETAGSCSGPAWVGFLFWFTLRPQGLPALTCALAQLRSPGQAGGSFCAAPRGEASTHLPGP